MKKKPTYEELEQRVKELEMVAVECKQTEKELRIKDGAIATSITAIAFADLEGNITYTNNSFLKLWGYDDENGVLGKPAAEFWQIQDQAGAAEDALRDKGGWVGELVAKRRDGSLFDVQLVATMITDDAGEPICMMGSFVDITERKRVEEALRETEEQYRSLIESTEDSIYLLDSNCTYLFMNKKHLSRLGLTADKVIGRSYAEFHSEDDSKELARIVEGVFETGASMQHEHSSHRDGRCFLRTLSPVKEADGKTISVTVISKDITNRKRDEEELRKSEETMRALLNTPPDGAMLIDPQGTILAVNEVGAKRLGKSANKLVGAYVYDFFRPDVAEFRRSRVDEAVRSRKPIRFVDESEETILDTTLYPVLGEHGTVEQLAVFAHEITEQKRTREALKASEAQKQAILDASVDRITLVDPDMRMIWANKTTTKELNMAPEDLKGEYCFEVLVDRQSPCPGCPTKKALTSGHIEHAVIHQDPSKGAKREVYWDNYAVPIKNESGDIVHVVQITRNITKQKLAERALREREKELKIKTNTLSELNAALRVLIEKKDNDRLETEQKVLFNVKQLVIPYLEKLQMTKLQRKQLAYVQILESNLNDVISPFSRTLSSKYLRLTPTEIHVANLVKDGKTSQEIAEVMNLSRRTVESHRDGIRKKLDLRNRKANLRSHLLSI
jgi:PAS domain S-box-containing protein